MLGLGNSIIGGSVQGWEPTPGWAPSDIGGLAVWHKNNTNVAVGQWNDNSGNDNHAVQGTSTNQAAVVKGGLHFDGVDNYYNYSDTITISADEAYTVGLVYELDSNNKSTVFSKDANNHFIEFFNANIIRINYAGSQFNVNGGNHTYGSKRHLILTKGATSQVHKLYEGGDNPTVTATNSSPNTLTIENLGVRNDNDRWFDGKIYEVMLWEGVEVSGDNIKELDYYLNTLKNSL